MADINGASIRESFKNTVYLEMLNEPAAARCGHNHCLKCIKLCAEDVDEAKEYSCTECNETFSTRSTRRGNPIVAEVFDGIKRRRLGPLEEGCAGPGDVECDFCTGRKLRASRSCLTCLVSYCEAHVQPHYRGGPWKNHKLVDPIRNLQDKLCQKHNRVTELYCRTDKEYVCCLCVEIQHKNHVTLTVEAERTEKQIQLEENLTENHSKIQERRKKLDETKQVILQLKASSEREIQEYEKVLAELSNSLEKVIELFRDKEKREVEKAEDFIKRIEDEIKDLEKSNREMSDLTKADDHISFLQSFSALSIPRCDDEASLNISLSTELSIEFLRKELLNLKEHLEAICIDHFAQPAATENVVIPDQQISEPKDEVDTSQLSDAQMSNQEESEPEPVSIEESVMSSDTQKSINEEFPPVNKSECVLTQKKEIIVLEEINKHNYVKKNIGQFSYRSVIDTSLLIEQSSQPMDRDALIQYYSHLMLDPNTAHRNLWLSENNRGATYNRLPKFCNYHPERFNKCVQVLCNESLYGGQFYWEVQWTGRLAVMGVTYKGISRKGKGDECHLGLNDKSWCLNCSLSSYSVWHDNKKTELSIPQSHRIGIYLDCVSGILSFYSVSNTVTHLHSFKASFTGPLYPGFKLQYIDSSVTLCQLNH
ncbi:E3 ubiquitin/ISG15 ligase TRIM25-like isoform X2 [Polypterus senegalus]|uniref:E3 ubiquitin/ISG15 ligase TRIM25-like isoform X2 n=1 Tax=Polypterus senegalus TaxID=55291 RepID=UPI0019622A99|nr:E3 ubiquitin/ISG15 ligase TRIM25-like isoform X2 [Polypterus senegalus]